MRQFQKRLWPEEKAQSLSEYVLLLALLAMVALAVMEALAGSIGNIYSHASSHAAVATSRQSIHTGPVPDNNNISTEGPSNTEDNTPNPR